MNTELDNILEKVAKLYNKYGIKSITMDDVAKELGISKKTLYQYVENKNELVSKAIDYQLNERGCTFEKIAKKEQNAIEKLLEVGVYIVKTIKDYNPSTEYDLKKYYPEIFTKLDKVRKERMYQAIIKNIQKGKDEGLYRLDMNDKIIAQIQVSRFLNINANELFNTEDILEPQYILELFIYHIRGIANKKGIEVLEKTLKVIDIHEYLNN